MNNIRESTISAKESVSVDIRVGTFPSHIDTVFSDELTHYTSIVNVVFLCTVLSVFGMFSNIVNMIVFNRLGMQETVNITLFATAMSDFISSTTTLWLGICYNPLFFSLDLAFLPLEVELPTGQIPHAMAMNITGWLTAFVTFERCVCVTFPLKVKDIITPGRTKVAIAFIFVAVVLLQFPVYLTVQLAWKFDFGKNQSFLGMVVGEENVMVNASIYTINVIGPFLSFSITAVCSVILVAKLYQKRKWRQQSMATSEKEEGIGNRDRRVMKMILIVVVVFMACNIPGMLIFSISTNNPEMTPAGRLANNYYVAVSFALVFETINACVNIFVYYNMSSKYKDIFRYIFCRESGNTEKST